MCVILGLLFDRVFGELRRGHPLVGFGRIANWLERWLRSELDSVVTEKGKGIVALILIVAPVTVFSHFLVISCSSPLVLFAASVVVVYFVVGARALSEHASVVSDALTAGDIDKARAKTALMVSRDTAVMNENEITKAVVESVLENGNDSVLAPIFWFVVGGIPGAVAYRLINTLDAMWGYRNSRYCNFGWASARADDLVNFIPARLCALSYALVGDFNCATRCWRTQASQCDSPNAGPVMAAGAGALNIELGGCATYDGKLRQKPKLGAGRTATKNDIVAALNLLQRAALLWILIFFVFTLGFL